MPKQRRQPATLMRLQRMGANFPTRLSFSRLILRKLAAAQATLRRHRWQMDEQGFGHAVYVVRYQEQDYSLVVFSQALADSQRTDRVIAEAWDTTYALVDGIADDALVAQLQDHVPKQEAGRYDARVLVLSRANKSVRLFRHVVDSLAAGRQPDATKICQVGYLMRTTAVYGNGKFGIADRVAYAGRTLLSAPFQAELLTVWLIRNFTHELVEYIAEQQGGAAAVKLDDRFKRYLGIGNSTGLGMAPFLVMHPILIHRWMTARETALAQVCSISQTTAAVLDRLRELAERVAEHLAQWVVADKQYANRLIILQKEWAAVQGKLKDEAYLITATPWAALLAAVETDSSLECQELVAALLLEAHGAEVDNLAEMMSSSMTPSLQPAMTLGELRRVLAAHTAWAAAVDFTGVQQVNHFWYVSEEKQEPRFGNRQTEKGAEWELPLDIARQYQRLSAALTNSTQNDGQSVAEFLLYNPAHRNAVRRVQALADFPYMEIQDNLIGEACLPIDMLRWKLSFFGATKFDPKSDLWTRVALFQGAPLPDDIANGADADDWWMAAMQGLTV